MSESKIELVEPKTFSINLPFMSAPMTVRTECDEVVGTMRLALVPGNNVMNVNINVSAGGNGAPVPSIDKDAPTDFSRYWTAPLPKR